MRRHAAADAPFYSTAHLPHPPASQLVSEARASLLHPTRPFTPAAAASDRAATLFWAVSAATKRPLRRAMHRSARPRSPLSVAASSASSIFAPSLPPTTPVTPRHGDALTPPRLLSVAGSEPTKPRKETMTATTMQTLCDDSADAGVSTDTADAVAHEDRGLDGDDEDNGARSSVASAPQTPSPAPLLASDSASSIAHSQLGTPPPAPLPPQTPPHAPFVRRSIARSSAAATPATPDAAPNTSSSTPQIQQAPASRASSARAQIERLDSIKPNASPDTDPEWLALLEVLGATTSMREDISTHELSAHLDRLDWLRSPSPAGAAKQDAPDPCRADSGVALLADAGPDALATATVASQPASAPRAANLADWDVEPPVNVDALARKRDAAVNRARDKRRRDTVVQALIKWMHEAASAASAVAASSLILRLTREEAVLLSACQMLFKLSKNEANDSVFLAQGGIDALLAFIHSNVRHIPTFFGPRCHLVIFAAGALKNITNGSPSQARLVKLGGVQRLGFAIRQLVDRADIKTRSDQDYVQACQLLNQISGVLRNAASLAAASPQFLDPVSSGSQVCTLDMLCSLLHTEQCLVDADELVLSVARILSKLSLHRACAERMSGKTNTDAFVDVLVRYQDEKNHPQTPVRTTRRKAVITRMCFVLANLSAERGDQHVHLAAHVAEIAALLGMHADAFMAQARASTSGIDGLSQVDGEDVDLATKIVRLVANMALDETCGRQLAGMAEMESMVDILYAVSDGGVRNEELALNIANALANLTFYLNSSSGLYSRAADIVRGLLPLLMHDNCEAVLEACRACANMSMCRDIGGFEDSPVCEIMTILLDHADPAVVWQACGVIMNLSAHRRASAFGATVLANEGDAKLCEVLVHAAGEQRWDVATAAAQALVNLCAAVGRQDVIARASAAAEDALAQTDPAAGHEAFWRVCDRLLELSAASDAGSDDAAQ